MAARNDPESVRHSRRGELTRDELEEDFLQRSDKSVWVAEIEGQVAGYVAFETGADGIEIGIALHPAHRGRGLGRAVLLAGTRHAIEVLEADEVLAEIFPANARSVALFVGAGYERVDDRGVPHRYRKVAKR